jgi:hypothetical protein
MELNRDTIIKALECCNVINGCKDCPYSHKGKPTDNGECSEKVSLDVLALIKSQEQKIKELTEEKERLRADTLENIKIRFAWRFGTYTDKDMTPITEVFRLLDQIAKAMLEGKDDND